MIIRSIKQSDWSEVSRIYKAGIETGMATFETTVPTWETWNQKYHPFCRLLLVENSKIAGWAALAPVSKRKVYQGVAEVSIYMDTLFRAKGLGKLIFEELITESEKQGIWTLQSGIFPENMASIHLHQKMGFRMIGYREKIAQLKGVWKDNVLLERRSTKNF